MRAKFLAPIFACFCFVAPAALADEQHDAAAAHDIVSVKNFMFSPAMMHIPAGATVIWKNLDGEPHTVVSDSGLFRSGALDEGDSFQFTFDKPGTYRFFCSVHPHMMGTIVVE
jgi:plastocyanin